MNEQVVAKESLRASILTYLGTGLGFLTTFFILTQFLSPDEIGLVRLLQELATLLGGLAMLGMTTSISRFFPYFRENTPQGSSNHNGFWFYIFKLACIGILLSFLALSPAFYIFQDKLFAFLNYKQNSLFVDYYYYVIPLSIIIVFWTISELYSIQMYHLAIPKGIREFLLRVLLLCSYLTFAFTSIKLDSLLLLIVGSYLICMFLSLFYLNRLVPLSLKHDNSFITPTLKKDFKHYTLLAILSTTGTTLAGRMDLLMVSFIQDNGLYEAGLFTIAFFMVSVVEIPTRSLISIATPRFAETLKEYNYTATKQIYKRVSYYQLLSGIILGLIIWVNFDNILSIMPNGATYSSAKTIFLFLLIAKLVELTFTPCHPIINCSKYYAWSFYYTILLCIIAFFSNLYLIPYFGTKGAAIATIITSLLGYTFLQIPIYRKMKIHPFSPNILYSLLIGVSLLVVNHFIPTCKFAILDIILRSLILVTIAGLSLFYLGLVPELKVFILSKLRKQ